MLTIRYLDSQDPQFATQLQQCLAWDDSVDEQIESRVRQILSEVKQRGLAAVLEYTAQFDDVHAESLAELHIPKPRLQQALEALPKAQAEALQFAAERVRNYHQKQLQSSWRYQEADGTVLGQEMRPLQRAGLYVPGGKAAYPSSVLMNAIPAKVAGVPELVMVTPTPGGEVNELVLAAAAVAGVDHVYAMGGAQAVAALAYGIQGLGGVDKIVGPGNIYVATAKRMVFGQVGIDMVAGPSEILVICDGETDPDWIAMDLFSQAEHDEQAQSILLSPSAAFLRQVEASMQRLVTQQPRQKIIAQAINDRGALIKVADLDEACRVANLIAPEHLELSVADPEALVPKIQHAGAIFLGRYTAEAMGDYCAGPNHVLPTSGTARFSSPLGVYDFQKRSSIIHCSPAGAKILGQCAEVLAQGEGLQAHAQSARYRC